MGIKSPSPTSAKDGRPSKFTPEIAQKICLLAKKGLTDKEVCQILAIAQSTLNDWKHKPEFSESLKAAKASVDDQVENSLLSRALGLAYEEKHESKGRVVRIVKKYGLPDVTACIFWLKNRRPDKWRDKREYDEQAENTNLSIAQIFRSRYEEERVRLAAGEDPALVLFGRKRGDNAFS